MSPARDAQGRFVKGGGSTGSVIDRDKGYGALMARLQAAAVTRTAVLVGVQGEEAAKQDGSSEVTVAEVASFAEFGLGSSPERAWLRGWFDKNLADNKDLLRRAAVSVIKAGITKEQALEIMGAKLVGELQAHIAAGVAPANAPATIARKGSSMPLIDTGQFRSSITHRVA